MRELLSCEQVVEGITDYLEAVIPPGLREDFDAHFRTCASCRRHLRQIRWTIDHLAAIPDEPMPSRMKATLIRALHRRQSA